MTKNTLDILNLQNNKFKNYIRNSNFDFNQRFESGSVATSTPNVVISTLDGWQLASSTTTTITASKMSFALGQTTVPNDPNFFMDLTQTSFTTNAIVTIGQCIENVNTLSGKLITVGFWITDHAGDGASVSIVMKQFFGTGGSPSPTNTFYTSPVAFTVNTTWQLCTATFLVPSVFGKTKGTNGDDGLIFSIQYSSTNSAGGNIRIAQCCLNEGAVLMPYRMMGNDIGHELSICQRYYEKSYDMGIAVATVSSPGTGYATTSNVSSIGDLFSSFKVTKRATPTAHSYSVTSGTINTVHDDSGGVDAASSVASVGMNAVLFNTAYINDHVFVWQWSADAEYSNLLS